MLFLPPGDAPVPEVGDDPRAFPSDFWDAEFWPWLSLRVNHRYADAAERDADLAGLAPTDRVVAITRDTNTVSMFNGSAWVTLSSPWTTFTAQIRHQMTTTPATITSTLIYGRYRWVGPKTVHAKASATITGNSTNGAGLQLPFTAAVREYGITASITGTSAPTAQVSGSMSSDKAHVIVVSPTYGFCDMATGNRISYDITYEVA